ncbi:MAG: tRNA (N6-threonylcarbamoyladenosine(37)-N6)-methyltransferase TrmO [Candidatus Helarchaeota archaeon]|nr:tRNA (N6-threonylcarbamoyladenosine(37)-N6)-methyltransferase TrmO [Candidatus Helarchaeota archaeon]
MKAVIYKPIGIIHSPYTEPSKTPKYPQAVKNIRGSIEILKDFEGRSLVEGLKDLEGFSHLILIYHMHVAKKFSSLVKAYLDGKEHGVFATRSPSRPNAIGLSVVKLVEITGNTLIIEDIDIIDGTPLLDIKPYLPDFQDQSSIKIGWIEPHKEKFYENTK